MIQPGQSPVSPALHVFGRYVVLARWASGGMADVYVARQLGAQGFDKLVALKVLRSDLTESEDFREMFFSEARTTALLSHPNIVHTFDAGDIDGRVYMVMEFVNGEPLGQVLRAMGESRRLPVPLALEIAHDIAVALHYAHTLVDLNGNALKLVHRDVSPANIMLTHDGGVKLLDFGIARVASNQSTTKVGTLKGTFRYMSPEQATRLEIDGRSDVFALGIVLWQLLTGKRAFEGDHEAGVLTQVLTMDVSPPSKAGAHCGPELDAIVLRACARDRDERYGDAQEFADALRNYRVRTAPDYSASAAVRELMGELFGHRARLLRNLVSQTPAVLPTGTPVPLPQHGEPSDIPALTLSGFHQAIGSPNTGMQPISGVRTGSGFPGSLNSIFPGSPTYPGISPGSYSGLTPSTLTASGYPPMHPGSIPPPLMAGPEPSAWRRHGWKLAAILLVALGGAALAFWHASPKGPRVLAVESVPPGATVLVDGQNVGTTPLQVRLQRGETANVSLQHQGYADWNRRIDANENLGQVLATLLPISGFGTVSIHSEPSGATVLVDDERQAGTTPVIVSDLSIHEPHRIVIRLAGFEPAEQTLTFERPETHHVRVQLRPLESAYLNASCGLVPCEVFVDGRSLGMTPMERALISAGRELRVELRQSGEVVVTRRLELRRGETTNVSFQPTVASAAASRVRGRRPRPARFQDEVEDEETTAEQDAFEPSENAENGDASRARPSASTIAALPTPSPAERTQTSAAPASRPAPATRVAPAAPAPPPRELTPQAHLGVARVDGLIDRLSLGRAIRALERGATSCYARAYETAAFTGSVTVRFTVNGNGRARGTEVQGQASSRVSSCLAGLFTQTQFPSSTSSDAVVHVPIRLSAQ